MVTVKTACERLLSRFIDVSATLRLREPASSTAHASEGDSTVSSLMSSTNTPRLEFSRSCAVNRVCRAPSSSSDVVKGEGEQRGCPPPARKIIIGIA